jgi:hypothetical protein
VIAMLFHGVASFARGRALMLGALVQHVLFGRPLFHSVSQDLVGMNVHRLIRVRRHGCVVDPYQRWIQGI